MVVSFEGLGPATILEFFIARYLSVCLEKGSSSKSLMTVAFKFYLFGNMAYRSSEKPIYSVQLRELIDDCTSLLPISRLAVSSALRRGNDQLRHNLSSIGQPFTCSLLYPLIV